jgi:hypothetical protein
VESKIAAFPSVVAAKKAAVNQLSYYRSMMAAQQDAGSAGKQPKFAHAAKAAAAPHKPAKK